MKWLDALEWADVLEWLNVFVANLSQLLVSVGVPEKYKLLAAFGVLYLGATIVVLLFILILLKVFRRPKKLRKEIKPAEAEAPVVAGAEPAIEEKPELALSLFERLKQGLAKTQSSLVGRVDSLLCGRTAIDEDLIEELEEILITADLGMQTTRQLIESLESSRVKGELASPEQVRQLLMKELEKILQFESRPLDVTSASPFVIMVVGVNGVGKTTTIGKLANQFTQEGKKVILGAGDTFRAAAAEQLQIWGERADVEVICHAEGSDPSAVAFDAARAAVARKADILLFDTAGRLHTKVNLMEELKKISRVLDREIPDAPHEILLVLDATTGQNALTQAKLFNDVVHVDGIALTKLDGTAKGGIVVAIAAELQVPVRFVGIGEKLDDLRPFDAEMFVSALFER
jgi:fused signal recognition particle receptor